VPGTPANIDGIEAAPDGRLLLLLLYNDRRWTGAPLTLIENWSAGGTAVRRYDTSPERATFSATMALRHAILTDELRRS
jgi:hypothetical protein